MDVETGLRFERDALPLLDDLFRNAMRLSRHRVDAEDLLQDTMVNAYRAFSTYQDGTNLRAWLLRIMTNRWISLHRQTQRRPLTLSDEIDDEQRSAEVEVMEALPDSAVADAFRQLSEDCRKAVYYADVEGFSSREIATLMNVPVGTVLSRLHRSRRRLRDLLADADCPMARQYTSRT